MKSIIHFVFVLLLASCLSACTSMGDKKSDGKEGKQAESGQNKYHKQQAMRRAAVVTAGSAQKLDKSKPSSITWNGELEIWGSHPVWVNSRLQQMIEPVIRGEITTKGYTLVPDQGDFQLQVILTLAGGGSEVDLLRQGVGMDPGLAGSPNNQTKSTLVLLLKQGRLTRWKGTAQVYLGRESQPKMARQRIRYALAQLLRTWP